MLVCLLQRFNSVNISCSSVIAPSVQVTQAFGIIDHSLGFPLDSLKITYLVFEFITVLSALFISCHLLELFEQPHVSDWSQRFHFVLDHHTQCCLVNNHLKGQVWSQNAKKPFGKSSLHKISSDFIACLLRSSLPFVFSLQARACRYCLQVWFKGSL